VNRSTTHLAGLRFALVGAGAVGSTLAIWFHRRGARAIAVAARRDSRRAAELARFLGCAVPSTAELESRSADLLLLAVPDDALGETARELARRPQAPVALHVAGALPPSAIAPLAAAGSAIGGFHPLRAFPRGATAEVEEPESGLFFALGGAPSAVALGRRLAAAIGGQAEVVSDVARPLYHLAATLVAGGIATLASTAFEIRRRAGIPPEADAGYALLAEGALAGATAAADPATAITGPAARGDLETFTLEARALAAVAPESLPVVHALGRESLRQRARIAPPTAAQERLAEALDRAELLDLAKDRVLTSRREPHG
jgi:predicted short-subunit dehydrogenase-like oxidoreductase (DUF2520 family)